MMVDRRRAIAFLPDCSNERIAIVEESSRSLIELLPTLNGLARSGSTGNAFFEIDLAVNNEFGGRSRSLLGDAGSLEQSTFGRHRQCLRPEEKERGNYQSR